MVRRAVSTNLHIFSIKLYFFDVNFFIEYIQKLGTSENVSNKTEGNRNALLRLLKQASIFNVLTGVSWEGGKPENFSMCHSQIS